MYFHLQFIPKKEKNENKNKAFRIQYTYIMIQKEEARGESCTQIKKEKEKKGDIAYTL